MNSSKNELSLDRFVDRVTALTPQLCRAMLAQEQTCLECDRLTMQEVWALEIIGQQEPCPQAALLDQLRLKPSTGTIFLNRMERAGLIRRKRPQANRRAVLIERTARGRKAIDQARRQRKAALRLLFEPLDASRRAQYMRMLEALTAQFTQKEPS